ncbi:MAG: hypothetical protein ACK4HF_00965 [Paracoccaceae bacterium]
MATLHAVLTGDLIHSTRSTVAQVDETMALIQAAAEKFSTEARFHRYRGDGWQVYVGEAWEGLDAMVFIAAQLRARGALSSRMALGLGDAYGLDHDSLGMAGGMAFIRSGRALDSIGEGKWLALAGETVDPLHHALIAYLDAQVRGWSQEQAEAVSLSLDPDGPHSQQVLAERLGISRQAFAARLNAAGFVLTEQAIRAFAAKFAGGGLLDG